MTTDRLAAYVTSTQNVIMGFTAKASRRKAPMTRTPIATTKQGEDELQTPEPEEPFARIGPHHGLIRFNWTELWQYRDLVLILAARDIRVRYKQTVIGAAWAVVQPLLTMLVFTILFGTLLGRGGEPTPEGIPYPISTFCALLPWQLFAHALTASSNSLVDNERLVGKVYFPRLILPTASVISGIVDFSVAFAILLGMMVFYGINPDISILALPLLLALAVLTALGLGLWLSALNALYRDVRYTIPFLTQIGMFVTPVIYASENVLSNLPQWAQLLYMLNPMAGVIEGFRWALLGATMPPLHLLGMSCIGVLALFFSGAMYFRWMERTLADWI